MDAMGRLCGTPPATLDESMIVLLLSIPLLLGLGLLILGWRGRRIDDHPLCRRCRYDLRGSVAATGALPAKCPECGIELVRPRSVRVGHRRRRRVMTALGCVVLSAWLAMSGILGWAAWRDVDLTQYKPLWLLRRDADGTHADRAQRAEKEIMRRLLGGGLSAVQVQSIIDAALTRQADPAVEWRAWQGDFIESAWLLDLASDDIALQYARNAVESAYVLRIRDKAHTLQPTRLYVQRRSARAGATGTFSAGVEYGDLLVDEHPETSSYWITRNLSRIILLQSSPHDRGTIAGGSLKPYLPIGPHEASIRLTFTFYARPWSQLLGGVFTHKRLDPARTSHSVRLASPFEIVDESTPIVDFVTDEELGRRIRARIAVPSAHLQGDAFSRALIVDVRVNAVPSDIAFEAFARVDDQMFHLGEVVAHEGEEYRDMIIATVPATVADSLHTFDLVLTTSRDVALRSNVLRVWDGVIEIPDILVKESRKPRTR